VRGWDLEFESGLLQQRVRNELLVGSSPFPSRGESANFGSAGGFDADRSRPLNALSRPPQTTAARHPRPTYWATWDNGMSLLAENGGKVPDDLKS
jgi:hypothetical protein